jgi:hypothetical protein
MVASGSQKLMDAVCHSGMRAQLAKIAPADPSEMIHPGRVPAGTRLLVLLDSPYKCGYGTVIGIRGLSITAPCGSDGIDAISDSTQRKP